MKTSGPLDGLTVLRFAHAFESGGGMERILDDLDRILLKRNRMTVIRMHIAGNPDATDERTESIGQGTLIYSPLPLPRGESTQLAPDHETAGSTLKRIFRDHFSTIQPSGRLGTQHLLKIRNFDVEKGK